MENFMVNHRDDFLDRAQENLLSKNAIPAVMFHPPIVPRPAVAFARGRAPRGSIAVHKFP
jgi:hypothetical protein